MKALCIYRDRPRVAAGASIALWGFAFTAQENGDLIADIPTYAIDAMEKADRVRRITPQEFPVSADKPLAEMTLAELRLVARNRGVSIPNGYTKDEVITLLEGKKHEPSQGSIAG